MKKNALITLGCISVLGCASLLYLALEKSTCPFIPVTFGSSNSPIIEVEIEQQSYPLMIDLGAYWQVTLDHGILQKIHKTPCGEASFWDFRGNPYDQQSYLIPRVKLGNVVFEEVFLKESSDAFKAACSIWEQQDSPPSKEQGSIGWTLLKRKNLLLDLPHSRIAIVEHPKNTGYCFKNMLKVPFNLTSSGITVTVETDVGKKRLSLDTGATVTVVRSFPCEREKDFHGLEYYLSSYFMIEGKNFGRMPLHLFDITPEMKEADGYLGMDFLQRHVIYIDFRKCLLYISERYELKQGDEGGDAEGSDQRAGDPVQPEHGGLAKLVSEEGDAFA